MKMNSIEYFKSSCLFELWNAKDENIFWKKLLSFIYFKDSSYLASLNYNAKNHLDDLLLLFLYNISIGDMKLIKKIMQEIKRTKSDFHNNIMNFIFNMKVSNIKFIDKCLNKNNNKMYLTLLLLFDTLIYTNRRGEYIEILSSIKSEDYRIKLLLLKLYTAKKEHIKAGELTELLFQKLDKNEYLYKTLVQNTIVYHLNQNNFEDMIKVYEHCMSLEYIDMDSVRLWLSFAISNKDMLSSFENRIMRSKILCDNYNGNQFMTYTFYMIFLWFSDRFDDCATTSKLLLSNSETHHPFDETKDKNTYVFYLYISFLGKYRQDNTYNYSNDFNEIINVIGESHSLSPARITSSLDSKNVQYKSNFIMGIKMWHLSNDEINIFKIHFMSHFSKFSTNSTLLITIGEIDCRPNEGIWSASHKKTMNIDDVINDTVIGFIDYIFKKNAKYDYKIIIQGIPAPNYSLDAVQNKISSFLNMIKQVNEKLKELTLEKGWNFLDVYSATLGEDGKSNKKWHIDTHHLSPEFYVIEAGKWLIKPEVKKQEPVTIDFSKPVQYNLSKPSQ